MGEYREEPPVEEHRVQLPLSRVRSLRPNPYYSLNYRGTSLIRNRFLMCELPLYQVGIWVNIAKNLRLKNIEYNSICPLGQRASVLME